MPTFAVRMVHGPNWNGSRGTREQDDWDAHAAFMDALAKDGFVIVGGPVGGGEAALLLVEAHDEDHIRDRMIHDPWADAQILTIGTIESWRIWLDGRTTGR